MDIKAPEKLWAWHWHSEWDAEIARFGYCRPTTRHALDERERKSGAEYVRIDIYQAAIAERDAALAALQTKEGA